MNGHFSKDGIQMARDEKMFIRKMQLKITMKFYLTAIGVAVMQRPKNQFGQGLGEKVSRSTLSETVS